VDVRKILFIPIFAVLITVLSLLPQDAHAATTIDLKDQASCEAAPLSGTWTAANSTCHISVRFVLNSGDSLTVDASIYSNIALTTTYQFICYGTITNYGTFINKGNFDNLGTINNYHIITNYGLFLTESGAIVGGGTINNYSGGIINNNHGQIRNQGTINNFGIINNHRLITNYPGSIINNNSKIKDYCGSTFTNNGTLTGNQVINKCDPTSTAVTPNPSSVVDGNTIKFNATVTDTSSSPTTATGKVSWSDGGAGGSFSSGTCTLVSLSSSQSYCQVTYTAPSTTGSVTITAKYLGNSTHMVSSGTSALTVT